MIREELRHELQSFASETLVPLISAVERKVLEEISRLHNSPGEVGNRFSQDSRLSFSSQVEVKGISSGAEAIQDRSLRTSESPKLSHALEDLESEKPHPWLCRNVGLKLFGAGNGNATTRRGYVPAGLPPPSVAQTRTISVEENSAATAAPPLRSQAVDDNRGVASKALGSEPPQAPGGSGLDDDLAEVEDETSALVLSQDKFDDDEDVEIGDGSRFYSSLDDFMQSNMVESVVGLIVLFNALLIGFETSFEARYQLQQKPVMFLALDSGFCVFFTLEIVLRICGQGRSFFSSNEWVWNYFDLVVVGFQIFDKVSFLLIIYDMPVNVGFLRILRILRLVRIMRIVRVLRLVEDLSTIVSSIAGSLKSLWWTMIILIMMIYTISVCLCQVVIIHMESLVADGKTPEDMSDGQRKLVYFFGTLERTFLTLFESIAGGLSWEEAMAPLINEVSWLMSVPFCLYIVFSLFALMNVVTGVFVEQAIHTVQEDKEDYLANHIRELFFRDSKHERKHISWHDFRLQLGNPDMVSYFKAINVDISEAKGLFSLMDSDGGGMLEPEELVSGLLRLRGPAKALQLSLLISEQARMNQRLTHHIATFSRHVRRIERTLSTLA